MTARPQARKRLWKFLAPLVALSMALATSGPLAADPASGGTAVADYAIQIDRLVRNQKYDDLAKLALPEQQPAVSKLAEWKDHYVAQIKKSEELRTKQYDEAVKKAQDALAKGRYESAMDEVVKAYLIAKDQEEFIAQPWVEDLTVRVAEQAGKYEKEGKWLESLQLFSDLNSMHEVDTRFKADMQRLARRTRLLALYTPKTLFAMRKEMTERQAKEKAEVEGTATQPATQKAEEEKEPVNFPRWQDHVAGITPEMMKSAVDHARQRWVEGTTYKLLVRGGVDALRLFLSTPELSQEFAGLADKDAKAAFAKALDDAVATVGGLEHNADLTKTQMHDLMAQVLQANRTTIKLPDEVVIMEFTDGAMEKLDPFTAVIWPHEVKEFEKNTRGTFGGVGIQISLENGILKVISPLEGTPAFKEGIEAGDEITAIDGKSTVGITIDQAVNRIMGEPDTKVKLTVKRPGVDEPIEFNVTRAQIRVSSVKGFKRDPNDPEKWQFMIDPESKIGYIRVTGFQEDTVKELRKAIQELKGEGMRGLVMDLRFNPGGLLNAAVEMSDMFIDRQGEVIVSTRGSQTRSQVAKSDADSVLDSGVPVVVLINQYSASASEIYSGAIKDLKRGLIVGQRSFGKGSVQNVIAIGDQAAIKLTMSYYYLPLGESLHRRDQARTWGVEPDLVVNMTPAQVGALIKARRDADVISKNGGTAPASAPATSPATQKNAEPLIDTQLDTALLMLRLQTVQPRL